MVLPMCWLPAHVLVASTHGQDALVLVACLGHVLNASGDGLRQRVLT